MKKSSVTRHRRPCLCICVPRSRCLPFRPYQRAIVCLHLNISLKKEAHQRVTSPRDTETPHKHFKSPALPQRAHLGPFRTLRHGEAERLSHPSGLHGPGMRGTELPATLTLRPITHASPWPPRALLLKKGPVVSWGPSAANGGTRLRRHSSS